MDWQCVHRVLVLHSFISICVFNALSDEQQCRYNGFAVTDSEDNKQIILSKTCGMNRMGLSTYYLNEHRLKVRHIF